MKTIALGLAVVGALVLPAAAADLPVKAPVKAPVVVPFSWTGFYIGANGGWAGGETCWNFTQLGADAGCHDLSGGVVGGQIGYNWQSANWVFGVEFSGDWADLTGNNVPALLSQGTDHSHVSGLMMATARVGYAWDRSLFYVRGGGAWVNEDYFRTCNGITATGACLPAGVTAETGSESRVGGVVGLGLEYSLLSNLSVAIEGDYLPFGTQSVSFQAGPGYDCGGGPGASCNLDVKTNLWMVTGRINWRFGGP
jgi:outer membrane immunogenic protein